MIIIVGASTQIGQMVAKKLNEENFNYLVLTGENDKISDELVQQKIQYWHWISYSQLNSWVENQAEEIEFIIWCDTLHSTNRQALLTDLWQAAYQFQIPFLALAKQENLFNSLTEDFAAPFFWSVLIVQNLYYRTNRSKSNPRESQLQRIQLTVWSLSSNVEATKSEKLAVTFAEDVVDLVYFFIHHRKNSGIYHLPFQQIDSNHIVISSAQLQFPKGEPQLANWPGEAQNYQRNLSEIGYVQPFRAIQDFI